MKTTENLKTMNILALACLIGFGIFKLNVLLYIAVVLLLISIISEKISGFIVSLWMKLGYVLGKINSTILLFIMFYCVLTPLAIAYRFFKHKDKGVKSSFFIDVSREYTKESFEKMW